MRALLLIAIAGAAYSQPITMQQFYHFTGRVVPGAVAARCEQAGGCYVLTHKELMDGLQSAHRAGQRSAQAQPQKDSNQ